MALPARLSRRLSRRLLDSPARGSSRRLVVEASGFLLFVDVWCRLRIAFG
jgi:hypothetical protein